MRRPRARLAAALVAATCGWLVPVWATAGEMGRIDGKTVHVRIEATQDAFYPGQDIRVKLIFKGEGDASVRIDPAAFARQAFSVQDAKGSTPRKEMPGAPTGEGLALTGFDTVERVVNLSEWYPKLAARTQLWDVGWTYGDLSAERLRIRITKPYDPAKDLRAVVQTDLGTMTWTLMPAAAPRHVKHFVDLVRQGFYDGLTIFKAMPGLFMVGGDPKRNGTGGWDYLLAPEISPDIEVGPGLVGALRRETSMTSHCTFFITAGPNEFMKGKQTFFARVTGGMDVLDGVLRLPSRGLTQDQEAFMLFDPVKIRRVTIRK